MESDDDIGSTSDEELQEAFAAGRLKPGLNIPIEQKTYKNNVTGLNVKIQDLKIKLPWIEKLDLNVQPAPIDPEMHSELTEKEKKNIVELKSHMKFPQPKGKKGNMALDDFKREMLFHRQAQATVLEGFKKLTSLGIPTLRPDDYFAEMAKSDNHMHKVRESLAARQAGAQRSERVSQLRRLKKLGKQTQLENKLKQQSDKKKMMQEVKNFRKGKTKDLNFLEKGGKKGFAQGQSKFKNKRKEYKNEKFGFGGKKRGSKRNNEDSNFGGGRSNFKQGGRGKGGDRKGGKGANKRLGKSRRMKTKGRK